MAHAQKPDSVFQRNGRVHLHRRGCQFSRVLAFLECGSAEKDCSNTGWTVSRQAEDCWLPTPFASFPFTSPPVRRRVPPDSVSTIQPVCLSSRIKRSRAHLHLTLKLRMRGRCSSNFQCVLNDLMLKKRMRLAAVRQTMLHE